jgi:predicted transcriptional regulator
LYQVKEGKTKPMEESIKLIRGKIYSLIQDGMDDIENGRTLTESKIIENMEKALDSIS